MRTASRRGGAAPVALLPAALLLAALVLQAIPASAAAPHPQGGREAPVDPAGAEATPRDGELTAQEAAGREIYRTGASPSGDEILAVMAGGTELPATALPCAGCHGEGGRGNPEGGVSPTDLTWAALTRPYTVRTRTGREHGPYSERLVARAIALGVDPAGNELHVAMPRYRMSHQDMDALVAYLEQLGRGRRDWDPGIGADRLRVGTLLPSPGPMEGVGAAIEGVLRAWAAQLAEGEDLYGRRVEVVPFTLPADPSRWAEAVDGFLDEEDVFALVGAFLAGGEGPLTDLLRRREVPLVGPFTQRPRIGRPVNPQVFYLLSGLEGQGRALVRFAHQRRAAPDDDGTAEGSPGAGGVAPGSTAPVGTVLHPEGDAGLAAVAGALVAEGQRLGWQRLQARTYEAGALDALGLASALATVGSRDVFFLGASADRQLLLQAAEHYNWRPRVYTPGSMAGPGVLATPPPFDGRLFLAFPTLPDDRDPEAVAAFRALAEEHDLPPRHPSVQLTTLAAARLFEEGVKRAGRDLSRARLVDALEGLYKWDTGLTPLLTYGPNRRLGARGAYVAALDLQGRTFRRVSGWIAVE